MIMAIKPRWNGVIRALLVSNFVSVMLFGLRVLGGHNERYWFLFWNLLLAWIPLFIVWQLIQQLNKHAWREPIPVGLTLLWLGFLPNSFYLISDLVHLQSTAEIGVLFDAVLFMSCIINGLVAGIISLLLVHQEILRRRGPEVARTLIALAILGTSYAIYLGRSLRWNTWDVLLNPPGLLFDISDHVIKPLDHPQVFVTTATFFLLIGSLYWVVWEFVKVLKSRRPRR
jgi:uncharacterized membrane protein